MISVVWGLIVIANMSWPREEIYGADPWGRFAAALATIGLVGCRRGLLLGRSAEAERES